MTRFSEDKDQEFAKFLRQHRPVPPPAAAHLEQRVMAAIAADRSQSESQSVQPRKVIPWRRSLWFVPSAIVASWLTIAVSSRLLTPAPIAPTEVASLETFLETNWHSSVNAVPDTEYAVLTDSTD